MVRIDTPAKPPNPFIRVRRNEWRDMKERLARLEEKVSSLANKQATTSKKVEQVRDRQLMKEPIGGPGNSVTDLED